MTTENSLYKHKYIIHVILESVINQHQTHPFHVFNMITTMALMDHTSVVCLNSDLWRAVVCFTDIICFTIFIYFYFDVVIIIATISSVLRKHNTLIIESMIKFWKTFKGGKVGCL